MLKLERMDLLGFKSFFSRTRFDFPAGITAVVGPNGCGKSNIGDAISWVLGDQSARSLRGEKMEDVIFNGSEKRKPLGMAEVSLTLQERNGLGGAETDSITITRRLYRSGESEYLINGTRSRLKDLRDLLERKRIATRLSSVIEQGKVDEVINAKPKERRGLFEEAAGIAGNQAKNRLAAKKLEAAEGNLSRVADILLEVESRIRSLKRQASKAKRYRNLIDRIRQLRAVVLHETHLSLHGKQQEAVRQEELRRREDVGWATRLSKLEADFERSDLDLRRQDEILADHLGGIHKIELENQRHLADRDHLRSAGGEIGHNLNRQVLRLQNARRELESIRAAIAQEGIRSREAELLLEKAAQAAAAAGADMKRDAGQVREMERQSEESQRRHVTVLQESADLKSRTLQLQEKHRGIGELIQKVEDEIVESSQEGDEVNASTRALAGRLERACEETRAALAEKGLAESERQRLAVHLEQLKTGLGVAEHRLGVVDNKLELLRQIRTDRETATDRLRALISSNGGIGGDLQVLAEGIEVQEGMEKAMDAVLGATAGAFLVGSGERAVAAWRTVRAAGEKGYRFVWNLGNGSPASPEVAGSQSPVADSRVLLPLSRAVLDSGPRGEVLSHLVRQTMVVGDLDTALELHAEYPNYDYVTIDGELVQSKGILEDGTDRPWGAFSLESRMAELDRERSSLDANRTRLRKEIDAGKNSLLQQESRCGDLDRSRPEAEKREMSLRLELEAKRTEAGKIERRRQSLGAQREEIRKERDRLEIECQELSEGRKEIEAERARQEGELDRLRHSLGEARDTLEEVRAVYQKTAGRRDILEIEYKVFQREIQKLCRKEEDLLKECEEAGRDRDNLASRRDRMETDLERTRIEIRRLEERMAELAREHRSLQESTEEIRAEMISKKEPIRETRKARQEVQARLREAELLRVRLDTEAEHLERECREEMGCGPDEIPAPAGNDLPDPAACSREVEELKGKVQHLGPVNLVALEELGELEERFGFLSGQRQDLLDSIASLRNTILSINRKSRERFMEAFETIRDRFHETFETLFGGGTAHLRLEDEEDPLEAGIEIDVQPPGKRLQSIRLLSGGEKALTAVALLFAVFHYRPSSFCVLDEVDAPLDEANVERFSKMLRSLTKETQFILITHSRRSMESADNLYGITMEESGVSKVMALKLERDH